MAVAASAVAVSAVAARTEARDRARCGRVGGPDFDQDPAGLAASLGRCSQLSRWLADRGGILTYATEGLLLVDAAIAQWREDPDITPTLGNEIGLYLGAVIVGQVPGVRWQVWPNGHPVVRLVTLRNRAGRGSVGRGAVGRDLDVVAVAGERVTSGHPLLSAILAAAMDQGGR